MKKTLMTLVGLTAMTLPAIAMSADAVEMDSNGDGMLSLEEVLVVYPDVTAETFGAADTDGDGLLNADEVAAAQESGALPAAPAE